MVSSAAIPVATRAPDAPKPGCDFCRCARPIGWDDADTDDTLKQVREHNAVGVELCGWRR